MAVDLEQKADGLAVRQGAELQATKDAVRAAQEVKAAVLLAKDFPRSENEAFARLMRTCERTSFADEALYSFKRGGTTVEGPSVALAREAVRLWGNCQYGFEIIRDDGDVRTVRGYAWDVECNTRVVQDATFKKLIQRKQYGDGGDYQGTKWVEPDERDMRELTNKHGSIAARNCVLQILPKDLIEDATGACKRTMVKKVEQDPEAAKKAILMAFSALGVPVRELEVLLGHAVDSASPAELQQLRAVWKSINDGAATWSEFISSDTYVYDEGESQEAPKAVATPLAGKSNSRLTAALERAGAKPQAAAAAATANGAAPENPQQAPASPTAASSETPAPIPETRPEQGPSKVAEQRGRHGRGQASPTSDAQGLPGVFDNK